jgi:hypothetical protein
LDPWFNHIGVFRYPGKMMMKMRMMVELVVSRTMTEEEEEELEIVEELVVFRDFQMEVFVMLIWLICWLLLPMLLLLLL